MIFFLQLLAAKRANFFLAPFLFLNFFLKSFPQKSMRERTYVPEKSRFAWPFGYNVVPSLPELYGK